MSVSHESSEGVTIPGDLGASLSPDVEGRHNRSHQPRVANDDVDDLSFPDTAFIEDSTFPDTLILDDLPLRHCEVRIASLDFGESVSNVR
jgi:hypothetical protein